MKFIISPLVVFLGLFTVYLEAEGGITNEDFVIIPAGNFVMGDAFNEGDASELPLRTVFVSAFSMSKSKISKADWDEVRAWGSTHGYTDLPEGRSKGSSYPIHTVSWYDAVKWCNARSEKYGLAPCYTINNTTYKTGSKTPMINYAANGYRLPTEAEWEKAARGGLTGKRFPWGDMIDHSNANYKANGSAYTYDVSAYTSFTFHPNFTNGGQPYISPVASFAPNNYGIHDMAGNLYDWCNDWLGTYGETNNPTGPEAGSMRCIRGGAWWSEATALRCSRRTPNGHPSRKDESIGFRLVCAGSFGNVRAAQLPGTHRIEIRYDLDSYNTVSLLVSENGGETYDVSFDPTLAITGDIGNQNPGFGKVIEFDASQVSKLANNFSRQLVFKVIAGNKEAVSKPCLLDTINPDIEALVKEIDDKLEYSETNLSWRSILDRNKRGVYFSSGLKRIFAPNNPWGFDLLDRLGNAPWSAADFANEHQGSLFMWNGGMYQNFGSSTPGWIFHQAGYADQSMKFEETNPFSTAKRDLFTTNLNDPAGGWDGTTQLYKAFEMPDRPNKLSWNGGESNEVEQNYRNLNWGVNKLVVVVHGWNPDADSDPYSGSEMTDMLSAIHAEIKGHNDWDLFAYNWAADAATGRRLFNTGPHSDGGTGVGQENGTQAAEIGYQHGLVLGKRLREIYPDLQQIHFIAHSAGTWVARSASLYLRATENSNTLQQQVTLLDPYNPSVGFADWPLAGGEPSVLGTAHIDDWINRLQNTRFENIYSVDTWVAGTNERYWGGSDAGAEGTNQFVNLDVGDSGFLTIDGPDGDWGRHGGPIKYYAWTAGSLEYGARSKWNARASLAGWQRSLFVQEQPQYVENACFIYVGAAAQSVTSIEKSYAAKSMPAMASTTWERIIVNVNDVGWVRLILIPTTGESITAGPTRIKSDGSFSITLQNGSVLAGQFDLAAAEPTLSLTLDGADVVTGVPEATGSSTFAGIASSTSDDGSTAYAIVSPDASCSIVVKGFDLHGNAWQASGSGVVSAGGQITVIGGNGFSYSAQIGADGEIDDSSVTLTTPAGIIRAQPLFANWITAHGASLTGELEDDDNDGVCNVIEFYRGTSPVVADGDSVVQVMPADEDKPVHMKFWQSDIAKIDGSRFEWSTDLNQWAGNGESIGDLTVYFNFEAVDSRPGAIQYEIIPLASEEVQQIYVRLAVVVE
ncbi:MAG: SUMF1/EgtB/PvdO family nonheme iron enzyme [Akkermansiaceae bacterium]|nr:SUMF1/EgtB/PvdO family nonheme iron enzyme [Akkermansiaceae bacterium]